MGNELQVMGLNIAICDDEKVIREQIKELAEKEMPCVCDGLYETGDALLAAGKQFDIVFLDIQMEGTDGIETAKRLRQRDEIHSSGIVIHPDGTVTHYISGDLKPEVRAKIEAKMKAEDEEKAKRKKRYQELGQEADEKRRMEMETAYKRQTMEEMLASRTAETGRVTYVGTLETMSSVIAAYEMSAFITQGILN